MSHSCMLYMEFVGMVVDRLGVRWAHSKINAVAELKAPETVKQVRSLSGMINCLQRFVPGFSAMVVPFLDFLRDKRYAS